MAIGATRRQGEWPLPVPLALPLPFPAPSASASPPQVTGLMAAPSRRILGEEKSTWAKSCAKAWLDLFTEYLTEEPNYKFSAECPCLGRKEKSTIFIHVDETQSTPMKSSFQRFEGNLSPV